MPVAGGPVADGLATPGSERVGWGGSQEPAYRFFREIFASSGTPLHRTWLAPPLIGCVPTHFVPRLLLAGSSTTPGTGLLLGWSSLVWYECSSHQVRVAKSPSPTCVLAGCSAWSSRSPASRHRSASRPSPMPACCASGPAPSTRHCEPSRAEPELALAIARYPRLPSTVWWASSGAPRSPRSASGSPATCWTSPPSTSKAPC